MRMGRGKIEITRIENRTKRLVTFSKRSSRLLENAHELSVLCDAHIGLIIFSTTGKLYQYCTETTSMEEIIRRYQMGTGMRISENNVDPEQMHGELIRIRKETHNLQLSLQRCTGDDLSYVQYDQLLQLEHQLENSINKVRATKDDVLSPTVFTTSCSNCYYEDNSSYTTNPTMHTDHMDKFNSYQDHNTNNTNTPTTTTTAAASANNNNNSGNLSIILDSQDEIDIDIDISASINFSPSPPISVPQFLSTHQYQIDFSSVQQPQHHQISMNDAVVVDGLSVSQYPVVEPAVVPLLGHHSLPSVFEEDCLSSVPSYLPLNPSSPSFSFLGPAMATYMPPSSLAATLSIDSAGIFARSILRGSELQLQELDFQGDNGGIFCSEMQRVLNSGDLQKALSGDQSKQLVGGGPSVSTPIASEMSSLEDSTFKVDKLSVEQRKEKIHRYMKKRNERNFSKKIKYACRKTLADSRPRVRGRFAKNVDFRDTPRTTCSNHEEDYDDEVIVKEEDDMLDSSDIFAHISGVNSFNPNYPIQSWI